MITMTEIARLAHVSQPTVSRVLNGKPNVAPEIRERVLACAREHDYQFNVLAKSLQGSRTQLLGVLVSDVSNSFFADLSKQIEAEARKYGYSMILFNSDYNVQREREYLTVARQYRVDGVLAAPVQERGAEWRESVQKLDIPVVAVTQRVEGVDCVYVDHMEAGAMVAKHMAERGYGRFLYIGEEQSAKYAGFRSALADLGHGDRVECTASSDSRQLSAFLETWFRRPSYRTGIFTENDLCALRVLSILRELGVPVPRRAGVMGFDNISVGRYLNPELSSVSQPIGLMAEQAVSRLLHRMDHPMGEPALELALPAELVVREST